MAKTSGRGLPLCAVGSAAKAVLTRVLRNFPKYKHTAGHALKVRDPQKRIAFNALVMQNYDAVLGAVYDHQLRASHPVFGRQESR